MTHLNESLDKLIASKLLSRYSDVKYDTLEEQTKCFTSNEPASGQVRRYIQVTSNIRLSIDRPVETNTIVS